MTKLVTAGVHIWRVDVGDYSSQQLTIPCFEI